MEKLKSMKSFSIFETNKIKGIAICLLVFHHMYRTIDDITMRGARALFNEEYVSRFAYCCRICVYIFAFITAYGLTKKYIQTKGTDSIRFILGRYIKLIMPYWFTLVSIWAFWGIVLRQSPLLRYNGNYLFLLEDFFSVLELTGNTENMFLGVFWYMNFAIVEILLIPFIVVICKRIGWYTVLLTALFYQTLPVIIQSTYGGEYRWYIFAIECGCLFAINDHFGDILEKILFLKNTGRFIVGLLFLLGAFVLPYIAWFVLKSEAFGIKQIFHTAGAVCMIVFSFCFVTNSMAEKLFSFIGKYSADIFLLHILIYEMGARVVSCTEVIIIQYIISICLCIIVSFVLNILKEKTGYNKFIKFVYKRFEE